MRHVCLLAAIKLAYSRVPWYEPCLVALPCICTSLSRKKFVALGSGNSWDERTTHAWFPTEIEMMQGRRHAWPLRFHLHACMSIDLIYPIHIYAACSFSQWLQMYSYFLVISHTWRVRPAGCMHACSMSSQHALCMHGTVQLKTYSYYSAGFWSEWWMPAYVQLDAINSLFLSVSVFMHARQGGLASMIACTCHIPFTAKACLFQMYEGGETCWQRLRTQQSSPCVHSLAHQGERLVMFVIRLFRSRTTHSGYTMHFDFITTIRYDFPYG